MLRFACKLPDIVQIQVCSNYGVGLMGPQQGKPFLHLFILEIIFKNLLQKHRSISISFLGEGNQICTNKGPVGMLMKLS
jgi:hypothetical protein